MDIFWRKIVSWSVQPEDSLTGLHLSDMFHNGFPGQEEPTQTVNHYINAVTKTHAL